MNKPVRVFEAKPAVRESVPLLVGISGSSGSGKTFSALRLAKGIQEVVGGDIHGIDTEARRMLHYADNFQFKHIQFDAPFGSLDYLAVLKQCVAAGAKVIVVDSMSHEHEGPGGLIDLHESELDRMAGSDYGKRERMKMLAWQKPKASRRALINGLLQLNANFIFCFRAKQSVKPMKVNGKTEIVPMGFMPIAGDEFIFEQTVNCLLLPNAKGVPSWHSENVGERQMIKLPRQFEGVFADSKALDEQTGRLLAQWAAGGKSPASRKPAVEPSAAGADAEPVPAAKASLTAEEYIARWDGLLEMSESAEQLRNTWQEQAGQREQIDWPSDEVFDGLFSRVKKRIADLKASAQ